MTDDLVRATEHYLFQLRIALGKAGVADREEILRELRSHVREQFAGRGGTTEELYDAMVKLFGAPEEIARAYRTEGLLAVAAHSWSPWRLLRTTGSWALTGVKGLVAFLVALLGYGLALSFGACAMAKPFLPDVGLWVNSSGVQLGTPSGPPGREVLGPYFIPASIIIAFMTALLTTEALRRMMRRFGQAKKWVTVTVPGQ